MAREFASIKLSIWQDDDFRQLSREAQHLYFVLVTHPSLSYCGVVDWRPARLAAYASNLTVDEIHTFGAELAASLYLIVDEDTEEVLIRSFIRNDGLMKQPRMAVSMAKAFGSVASRSIQGVIVHELNRLHLEEPDLGGWCKTDVSRLLEQRSVDPTSLPQTVSRFAQTGEADFGPNAEQFGPNKKRVLLTTATSYLLPATSSTQKSAASIQFDQFWDIYPRKAAKQAALKAFTKAVKDVGFDTILTGAKRLAADPNLEYHRSGGFIPHPATWLNAGQWEDEPLPPAPQPKPTTQRGPTYFGSAPGQMRIEQ
jgi:hypothetical protein